MKSDKQEIDAVISVIPAKTPALEPVMLQAEPQPLEIDLQRAAVMVIDMQNAFVTKGGMMDLRGIDISSSPQIIEPINRINSAARAKGCKVIHVVTVPLPDLRTSGGPNRPSWYKESTHSMGREHPEWRDKLIYRGTWGAEIVDGLKVEEGDIIFEKMRYSAFFQTNLDTVLTTYDIKYLVITGTATNICVEGSIRDAYYLGYFPILVSDAAAYLGPPFVQDATIFNVKSCYGWVTTSENIVKAIESKKVATRA